MPPRSLHHRLHAEDGFTIVEVLVAAAVLLIGLLGTLTLVDTANTKTFQTKAREQATSLQREIVESARAVAYDELVSTAMAGAIQGRAALADTGASAGWSVARRGETYTIAVGTCMVDDARDGTGEHSANTFCDPAILNQPASGCQSALDRTPSATAPAKETGAVAPEVAAACGIDANLDGAIENLTLPGETTCEGAGCDLTPADSARVVSMVRWEQDSERRQNLMVTTLPNPGLSAAPAILSLDVAGGTAISSSSATSVTFTATASDTAESVNWYLDGAVRMTQSAEPWTWTWNFGAVGAGIDSLQLYDGTYVVGAKAFNKNAYGGSLFSKTLVFNRRKPFAPQGLKAGRNGAVVDLAWSANPEGDLRGYRVYRVGRTLPVCDVSAASLACQDDDEVPGLGDLEYYMVALDSDPDPTVDALREGDASATATAPFVNSPPSAPIDPIATPVEGGVKLTWTRPDPEDPNAEPCGGTEFRICHYTIYRDGQAFANRYDRTATGAFLEWTDTEPGVDPHTYFVASVDVHLAESPLVQAQLQVTTP